MVDGVASGTCKQMVTRNATVTDADAIVAISRSSPWDKDEYLHRQLAQGNILLAEVDYVARGFAVWNFEFFSLGCVWLVVVEPAFRRRGIASQLFDEIESRCRGRRLYSSTNRSQDAMHRFFKRRGYQRAGEIDLDAGDPEVFYELRSS